MDEMLKDLNGPWPTAQRRVLRVLEGVFDDVSVEKAEKAGYDNTEE